MHPGEPEQPGTPQPFPGYLPPPPEPPAQFTPRTDKRVWIFVGVLAVVATAAAILLFTRGKASSDEEQVRSAMAAYGQAVNNADADRVNALTCRQARTENPATESELRKEIAREGSYTIVVRSVDIDGDQAKVRIDVSSTRGSDNKEDLPLKFVREDGSWKRCDS